MTSLRPLPNTKETVSDSETPKGTGLRDTIVGTLLAGVPILVATPFISKVVGDAIESQGVISAASTVALYVLGFAAPFVVLWLLVFGIIRNRGKLRAAWARWGWRPLSTRRKRQVEIDAAVELARVEAARAAKNEGFKRGITRTRSRLGAQSEKLAVVEAEREKLQQEVESLTARLSVRGEATAPPDHLPPLSPRWTLLAADPDGDDHGPRYRRWRLVNLVPDSAAFNVRIDASPQGRFRHTDAAAWKDLSGKCDRVFGGHVSEKGALEGFKFVLWWSEGDPDFHPHEEFHIAATENIWGEPLVDF